MQNQSRYQLNSKSSASMAVKKTFCSIPLRPKQFPSKLWHLVNDPDISTICWDSSGEGILINEETFEAEMLSPDKKQMKEHFKLRNFNSFIRQINLYGFKKLSRTHDTSYNQLGSIHRFHNLNFKRANPELLVNLKRLTPANRAKLAAGLDVPSQSKRYQHLMLISSQKYTLGNKALKQEQPLVQFTANSEEPGPVKLPSTSPEPNTPEWEELPTPLCPPCCNGFHQVNQVDTTPTTFRELVHGEGMQQYSQSPDQTIPHHSACISNEPVYQRYSPDGLDSNVSCSEQSSSSNTFCGFHPESSVDYHQYNAPTANWHAGAAPDPRMSDGNLNAETQCSFDTMVQLVAFYHVPSSSSSSSSSDENPIEESLSILASDV